MNDDDLLKDLARIPSMKEQVASDLAAIPKAPPVPPVQQTIGDYAKRLARGAASQLVTAPGQMMVRAGMQPVTRDLGLRLEQQATESMSPAAKAVDASPFLGEGDDLFGPYPVQKALSAITESAPGLIGLAASGRLAAAPLQQARVGERVAGAITAAGAPKVVGRAVGEVAETAPFWIGEGLQAAGANAAQSGQQLRDAEQTPVEKMAGTDAFQKAMRESLTANPGWSPQQHIDAVRESLAQRAEGEAFDKTALATGGIGAITGAGALGVLNRRLGGQDTGGFLRTMRRGAVEEALQEMPQSGGEQLIANYVARKYGDPEQSLLEGVGEAVALGGVAGAATGGGLAAGAYPFTRRRPPDDTPPGVAPEPMAPPPDPNGPLGAAVAAGQQSGAIPTNPIGGPVDEPAAVAPEEADPKRGALSEVAGLAAAVPAGTNAPETSALGRRIADATSRAAAAGATPEEIDAARAGQLPQQSPFEQRASWPTLPEVESFLSQARQQSPQAPVGKPVQRADGSFTFALPGEPEFDALEDARNAPAVRADRERQADENLRLVESLTRRLAQTTRDAQKARDAGDTETADNAEALAGVLRERLQTARAQLESTSGTAAAGADLDAGTSAGVIGNGGVGAPGRRALPGGGGAAGDAGMARPADGAIAPEGVPAAPADGGGARPVVLQNRDRSGVASVTQMQSIAASPDPKRLSFSRDFGSGAPVVFANADALQVQPVQLGREDTITDAQGRQYAVQYAVIEADQVVASNSADGTPNDLYQDSATPGLIRAVAGNGRMAGLQEAYRRGTATDYARGIAGDAALHGVDPAVIDGMANPVLVRIMRSADVTPDIGDRSNVSGAARLNPVEQARTDMARVNLETLDFTESGDPTPEAVKAFVAAMPESERSELMTRGGAAGRQAIDRLMAATFAKAYGDDTLVELYAQATDPEARNVLSAMAQAAGAMARLEGAGPLDVRPLVRDAAAAAVNSARRGVALSRFAQQVDMTVAPETRRIVEMFARNARSSRKMAEALRSLADLAYSEVTKADADMFGEVPRRTRAQVIEEVFGGQGREDDAGTVQNAGRDGVDGQGAGGQDGREDERPAAGDAGQPQGQGSDRPADGQDDAFGLTSYSLDELARADAQRQQEQADQARRDAAPPEEEFTLAGSDSRADRAIAAGQMELAPAESVAEANMSAERVDETPKGEQIAPVDQAAARGQMELGGEAPAAAPTTLFGMSGAQLEAMQGGRLKGAEQFPGAVPTEDQRAQAARRREERLAEERRALDDAAGSDPRLAALRDAGVEPGAVVAAAKELRSGDDSLLQDLARIHDVTLPAPADEAPKAEAAAGKQTAPIADFGEKIGGARKDTWASFKNRMQQAESLDVATEPLSKTWPAPDYQALLDGGADPWAVAFMHAVRDEIPAKPKRAGRLKAWAEQVKMLRDLGMRALEGRLDARRVKEMLGEAAKTSRGLADVAGRAELYELVGHGKSLAGVRISRGEYSLHNGIEYKPPKIVWTVEKDAAATAFSNWPRELASGATREEAIANFKAKYAELEISPPASREATFEIYSRRGENGYWIGKKLGRNPAFLAGPFATIKEARAYKDANKAELVEQLAKFREIPRERRDTNEPRVGEDMRGGQDVTPAMFSDAFGFRGVEFGNWVEQKRRQKDLNDAYDALMDMAAVLGVHPKALSLNGELGLAFGARGSGGVNPAAAHYEPTKVVINLTKKEGAGSLGHEWWHALDNYFSRMRGKGEGMMTESLDVSLASKGSEFIHKGEVRKEMVAAFGEVMKAIRATGIRVRSAKLDAKRTKEYWTTPDELSARAFESYLIAKLKDQGASNDYLANIVDEKSWAAAEALGFEIEDSYPYPRASEVPTIRAAFDHFFQAVETRETDTGIAIYEPAAQYDANAPRRRYGQEGQPDLFTETGADRAPQPAGTGLPGDVQPAAAVQDTPAPQGEYLARTIVGVEARRTLGASVINSPEDAARATRYLYRHAVERFDAIVTDAAGKPLAVVGGFKGAQAQSAVYPATLMGEAVRVPGAARIWFSHNHPSGTAELSQADLMLNRTLADVFRGSGIEPMGTLAVTGKRFAYIKAGLGNIADKNLALPDGDERLEVPVVERMLVDGEAERPAINNPGDAMLIGATYYGRANAPGMMLLDSQNRVLAWVPVSDNLLGQLRNTGGLNALYRAVSEANAGGAIIVHGGELDGMKSVGPGVSPIENLGAALAKVDVTLLDAINVKTRKSAANQGEALAAGPVFSKPAASRRDVTGMDAARVTRLADAIARAWANGPEVVVVQDMQDMRIPEAVRRADAQQRSGGATGEPEGFFFDGKVYLVSGQLGSPADVVRVLSHEALGHYGLRGLFGGELGRILDQVANVRRAEVTAKLQEYGLPDTAAGRRVAAEEVLAVMAQTNPQMGFVRRAVAAIRQWLRGLGLNLQMTDADIVAQFIIPARQWVVRGGGDAAVAVPSFSRGATASRAADVTQLGFYSELARKVEAGPGRADAANWKYYLKAQKGIKPDELEWSGINEFLDLQQGKITKEAVREYLAANGVRVEEVVLGDPLQAPGAAERRAELEAMSDDEFADEVDEWLGEGYQADGRRGYLIDGIMREQAGGGELTKFGQYVLPGGTYYREVLLTLPGGAIGTESARLGGGVEVWIDGRLDGRSDSGLAEARAAAFRNNPANANRTIELRPVEAESFQANREFRSSHWDQPNVLAHVRLNDRTDADGKRVLFVEEIQSDWAQKGRKEGFSAPLDTTDLDAYEQEDNSWNIKRISDRTFVTNVRGFAGDPEGAIAEAARRLNGRSEGVPPAPFVQKTDAWVALAIKRIVRMAAEGGYDRVAFVTGAQAAERFDLSKQIDRIRYAKSDSGTVSIDAIKDDRAVLSKANLPMSELEELVGKEVAQRIADDAGTTDPITGYQELTGLDLQVGGEGMIAFYDKIVPTVVKDVLKKLGGGRMEGVTIEDRRAEFPLRMDTRTGEEEWPTLEQPGFDITPAMRDTVLEQGMPLFSRKPTVESVQAAVAQAANALRGATLAGTWQKVVNAATDVKPIALQFLSRRQIVEVYGNLLPQLQGYSNRMQQYDADKNESAAAADEIVHEWRKLPDADRLADVMHGATLAGYDPDTSKTPAELLTPEMRAVYDGFTGLTPEAKALYRKARDAYRAHWNAVKQAIGERIERADIAENDRRALMEQYRDQFLKPIEGVYFPLARFGDYVITAKDADGNKVVAFAETMSEAQAEQARMRRDYQDVSKITKRQEYNAARDSVSKDFVRQLFQTIDKTSTDGQQAELLKDAVNQLYLTSLPDVSWAKHGIHRKGVAGYSRDARRAFAANMFHGGYHLAKLRHADVLQDYLREMQEHVEAQRANEAYDSVTGQQVVDEMVKRHDATMNPDSNWLSNYATSLGFVWFLGLSPASAIVNLSQTALVAYPVIAARYGFGATADALTRASKEALAARNDLRGRLEGDEAEAYERAIREGVIDITQAHDLAGIAEGRDSGLQSKFSPVMRAASWMFHQAEKFNRQATFLAAYRLARGKGAEAGAAYDIARDLTYKGHFDYASSNRPRVMMGPVARVALLFKQYGQNMIYTLARNGLLAARGDKEALKTLSGVLVGHAMTAGILGLPLASVLLGAASILGGTDDEPWDAEAALRNYLADALGPALGEVVSRGVFRSFFPGDIASRVGLDSLLIRDIDLTLEPNKVWQEILNAVLGPIAGIGMNVAYGAGDLARGDLLRGLQGMLPKAVSDGFKALRYWNDDGVVDRTGIDVLDEVTARDLLVQVAGFTPARVSEAYAGRRAIMDKKRGIDQRRESLLRDFSTAVIDKDHEKRLRALQEIQHFNQVNPTMAITQQSMLRSIQNRVRRQAQASGGVYLPRRQRELEQEGRFANVD